MPLAATSTPTATTSVPTFVATFGPFRLDAAQATLQRGAERLPLLPRDFDVLCFLAARAGRLVTKDELLDGVWGHRHVTESVLKTVVSRLRAALGDDAKAPQYIETVPRRGYRFIGLADGAPVQAGAAPIQADEPGAAQAEPTGAVPGNLPPAPPPLHGREADLGAVQRALGRHRLVTLTGPGGIGKTRLALALAHAVHGRHAGGAWWVELAGLADAAAFNTTVAAALELGPKAAQGGAEGLARMLAAAPRLVVLDNAEHLAEAVADFTAACARLAPALQLLVTSQVALRVAGEHVHRLHGLAVPFPHAGPERRRAPRGGSVEGTGDTGAVTLFIERVRALLPGWSPAPGQADTVAELCRRLDGIPLAIELAAARVPLLGVEGTHARLNERLQLLTRGRRDAPARQRTLAQALAWSHALLPPREQQVWRRLAAFAGSFTAEAAEQVAGIDLDRWQVLEALERLVDHSLVQALPPVGRAPPRLRLLESPRDFARAELEASGEAPAVRSRHARATLARVQTLAESWLDLPTFEWQTLILPEIDNLRAAHATAAAGDDAALQVGLAAYGASLWMAAGAAREAVAASQAARPKVEAGGLPEATVARYWHSVAQLGTAMTVPPAEGMQAAQRALAAYRALGDRVGMYWSLNYMIALAQWAGGPDFDPQAALDEMCALEGRDWPLLRRRPLRFAVALQHMLQGRWAECRDAFAEEYRLAQELGDLRTAWVAGGNVAHAMLVLGDAEGAAAMAGAVVAQARAAGRLRIAWGALGMQALALVLLGRREAAEAAMRELLEIVSAEGALWWAADYWPLLLALRGDLDNAARLHGLARAMNARLGTARGVLPQLMHDRLAARLADAHAPTRLAELLDEGAAMEEADVRRLVREEALAALA
jgi:predicted ATPase/DNA-binding winged helix-turn-helix (wHTH) protein